MPELHPFTAESLARALSGLRFAHPLHYFDSVGSTNDEARRLAEAGAPEGTLVVADEQTAGRGRAGRRWQTSRGAALAASFILRPDLPAARLGRLTMLGGLAAAEAIESAAGLAARLKWPNDVLLDDKKVCGVLVETAIVGDRIAYAVLGIGINVNAGPAGLPATSLAEAAGRAMDRVELLAALARRLELRYEQIAGEELREAWAARLAWKGRRVRVTLDEKVLEGVAEDVDAAGSLLVRLDSGEVSAITVGDVSLRPSLERMKVEGGRRKAEDAEFILAERPSAFQEEQGGFRPVAFIAEPVEVEFDAPPALEKKPGCPDRFTWRGARYVVIEKLSEWHEYRRRGRAARNMRPSHAAVAEGRGSWGVGRDYFRVRVDGGRIFDLYYDRAPKGSDRRKGAWVLMSELNERPPTADR